MSNTNKPARQSVWDTCNVEITSFKKPKSHHSRLLGYATVYITELDIYMANIPIFDNNGHLAILPPSIPPNADTPNPHKWFQVLRFCKPYHFAAFEKKVLKAYEMYIQQTTDNIHSEFDDFLDRNIP